MRCCTGGHAAAARLRTARVNFQYLGWGDAEAAELLLALRYAAAKCTFPEGAVGVAVKVGNRISEAAMATLPPGMGGDFTGDHAEWKGKFYTGL